VLLRAPLQTLDTARIRPAISRWLKVVLAWQVVVVALAAGYTALVGSAHPVGFAWVAPAIAAIFGTALPLQVAVVAILRASRGS
jgi:hypothetical protein